MITGAFKIADKIISFIETTLLTMGLIVMIGSLFVQVVGPWFGASLPWAGELATYLMVWIACTGASAATRDGRHIAIELLSSRLKGFPARALKISVSIFCCVVCAASAYFSWQYVSGVRDMGQVSIVLKIPMWLVYTALPVAAALMAFRFLALAVTGPPKEANAEVQL